MSTLREKEIGKKERKRERDMDILLDVPGGLPITQQDIIQLAMEGGRG
jgi:hypothetical protein